MYIEKNTNVDNIKMRNKKGFTLIELIVVILILGVIAAVAVPKITVAVDKAKEATAFEGLRNLRLVTMTVAADDPWLGVKPNVSPNNESGKKKAAGLIASALGQTVENYKGYTAHPYISNIEIPGGYDWYFDIKSGTNYGLSSNVRLYAYVPGVKISDGEKIGGLLGLGKPTFLEDPDNPMNENIHWSQNKGQGRTSSGLFILLHVYDYTQ